MGSKNLRTPDLNDLTQPVRKSSVLQDKAIVAKQAMGLKKKDANQSHRFFHKLLWTL